MYTNTLLLFNTNISHNTTENSENAENNNKCKACDVLLFLSLFFY
jgi:hypothetical protein